MLLTAGTPLCLCTWLALLETNSSLVHVTRPKCDTNGCAPPYGKDLLRLDSDVPMPMLQRLAQERGQGDQVHVWNHRLAQGSLFHLPRLMGRHHWLFP